jgi:hypothetical protein
MAEPVMRAWGIGKIGDAISLAIQGATLLNISEILAGVLGTMTIELVILTMTCVFDGDPDRRQRAGQILVVLWAMLWILVISWRRGRERP